MVFFKPFEHRAILYCSVIYQSKDITSRMRIKWRYSISHWLIFPYPSGLLHWHCGNLTIAPVPAKQPWWIWINTSCEFIMNDYITTTKQSTTKPCAYFLEYTVQYDAVLGQFHLILTTGTPSGRAMGCMLWVQRLVMILLLSVQPSLWYHDIYWTAQSTVNTNHAISMISQWLSVGWRPRLGIMHIIIASIVWCNIYVHDI